MGSGAFGIVWPTAIVYTNKPYINYKIKIRVRLKTSLKSSSIKEKHYFGMKNEKP